MNNRQQKFKANNIDRYKNNSVEDNIVYARYIAIKDRLRLYYMVL